MLCDHISSCELENQRAKDRDTADRAARDRVKTKEPKVEAHKPIHNSSQTLAASKETFTQPQPAGFTGDKEKLKADPPVCYNCSKAGHLKHDCPEPQQPGINHMEMELHELEEDHEEGLETENFNT